jgi:hypothetical protein
MQNSILLRHHLNYLESINKNKKLVSLSQTNLSDLKIQILYNKEYKLTEFDRYKYITAYDYITDSLGCDKYNLNEGIT